MAISPRRVREHGLTGTLYHYAKLDAWLASFDHAGGSGDVTVTDATTARLSDLRYT